MNEYTFSLPYPPSNNRYYRHSRGFHYISKVGKEYREQVRDIIELLNLNINLSCRLAIAIYAAPPDNRIRDLDNIPKCLFDSLTYAGFWTDDGQIDSIKIVRCQKIKGGRLFIKVRERGDLLPDIGEYETNMWGVTNEKRN